VDRLVEEGYDIVHTHHNRSAVGIAWQCRGRSIPHFNTQHGHIHYSTPQKAVNLATLALTEHFSYNSTVTKTSYNWVENILRSGGFHRVIHNGVDLDRLSPFRKEKYGRVDSLVTAARLIPRKNLETVIDALEEVPEIECTIVGEGPVRDKLQARAEQRGVDDRVTFTGYVQDRQDVYRILSRADAFVLPSWSEGFCVAVAEAMALGLPVVVSDIPVFHEVVGEEGVFADPERSESLADALRHLVANPEEGERRGRANRRRICRHFTLQDTAAKYVEAYRDILQAANR
jgi:glycosyltransferase involved in cell wall biosynthesis